MEQFPYGLAAADWEGAVLRVADLGFVVEAKGVEHRRGEVFRGDAAHGGLRRELVARSVDQALLRARTG